MKLLVLGAGDLGLGILKGLAAGQHQVLAVFPWESLRGARGARAVATHLKRRLLPDMTQFAQAQGWPLLQPTSVNSELFAHQVRALAPEVMIVAGWGEILRANALELPSNMVLNCHPSLLPAHRGADPIGSVLRAGESRSGITYHQMTAALDAGPMVLRSEFPLTGEESYSSLARKISQRAAETVLEALERVASQAPAEAQDESQSSYWPRASEQDRQLDWQQSAAALVRQVRAAGSGKPAYTWHSGQLLRVLAAEPGSHLRPEAAPGEVVFQAGTHVCVATGAPGEAIWLTRVAVGRGAEAQGRLYALLKLKPGERLTIEPHSPTT